MKVLLIKTRDGGEFWKKIPGEVESVEVVEMTEEEYFSIPATPEAADFSERLLGAME